MYLVFDCTQSEGNVFTDIPTKGLAHFLSEVMYLMTGNIHDFDVVA